MAGIEPDKTFLGIGWKFPPQFHRRAKDVMMVSAEDDIRESLRILLSTAPGERTMQPAFGCGLNEMVFDLMSESTITDIKDRVARAILFFEPRITLDEVVVTFDDVLGGIIRIHLHYTVRATNTRSNLVYPFYREGTNLGLLMPDAAG